MLKRLFGELKTKLLNSPVKRYQNNFLRNEIPINRYNDRVDFFIGYCQGKDVIHFGCTDYPIFSPETNLHIKLSKFCKSISGFDIDIDGIEILRKFVNQAYYSKFEELQDKHYDVCLIPETIEHVDNIALFLDEISKIKASTFIITAPNCFSLRYINRNYEENFVFNEFVHPDHNCWFSPYTLTNVIKKYTSLVINSVCLLNQDTMVAVIATKVIK